MRSPARSNRTTRKSVVGKDLLVDEPYYCSSCGSQYYVTGGVVSLKGGRRVRLYSFEDINGETESYSSFRCPACLGDLAPLGDLESLFGESLRSF